MRVEPHEPIGATVLDVDLARLTDGDHDRLRDALADHGVLAVPDQRVDDDAFAEFLRGFGELQFTDGEQAAPGHTDLNLVTNVGRERSPVSNWHVDTAYVSSPPSYTALRAVDVPDEGGATMFTNQYRAWDTLAPSLREHIADRTMTHHVTGLEPGEGAEIAADHPLVRPHPRSGRPALLLDAPARCGSVSGLGDDESEDLVANLLRHSTCTENVWCHTWSAGDVVIWDNAVVLHRADHSGVVGDRTFHRGMVVAAGYSTADHPTREPLVGPATPRERN